MTRPAPGARYGLPRRDLATTLVWLAFLIVATLLWRTGLRTTMLAQPFPRAIPVIELAGVTGATLAAALQLSQVPSIDRMATRPLGYYAAARTLVLIAAFSAMPLAIAALARWAPGLLPTGTPNDVSDEILPLHEVFPFALAATTTAATTALVSLAVIAVLILGPGWGTAAGLGLYLGALLLQSSSVEPWVPIAGGGPEPFAARPLQWPVALTLALAAAILAGRLRGTSLAR